MQSEIKWTFFHDYDPMHRLEDHRKPWWLRKRLERLVISAADRVRHPLTEGADARLVIGTNLGLMTLLCCVIEALGHFLEGRAPAKEKCEHCQSQLDPHRGRADFRAFVNRYIGVYAPVSDLLYDEYRSALAHGLAIREGAIERNLGAPYELGPPHRIDFDRFIDGTLAGVDSYFGEVEQDEDLLRKFLIRWRWVHGFWEEQARLREEAAGSSA